MEIKIELNATVIVNLIDGVYSTYYSGLVSYNNVLGFILHICVLYMDYVTFIDYTSGHAHMGSSIVRH